MPFASKARINFFVSIKTNFRPGFFSLDLYLFVKNHLRHRREKSVNYFTFIRFGIHGQNPVDFGFFKLFGTAKRHCEFVFVHAIGRLRYIRLQSYHRINKFPAERDRVIFVGRVGNYRRNLLSAHFDVVFVI